MSTIESINTIYDYNEYMGVKTIHPLVSVVDMSKCSPRQFKRINYGLYCIFLKNVNCGPLRYGINYYDYQDGTIVAVAPGQIFGVDSEDFITPKGWALVFHPDIIYGTDLGRCIKDYTFFSYDSNEALHVSQDERDTIEQCFHNIQTELSRGIDKHTKSLVCRSIGMLLDYCMRFYDRQFITRSKVNQDILTRFENVLDDYYHQDKARREGLPSVAYCAEHVFLSPNYFGDLIKKETGKTAREYISLKIIEMAKQMLSENELSINEIADKLGFAYPTHFTRLFKKCVKMSPTDYRMSC